MFVCKSIVWYVCMHEGEEFVYKSCGMSKNHLRVNLRCAGY